VSSAARLVKRSKSNPNYGCRSPSDSQVSPRHCWRALQTFLGYSERAEKHRIAGAKYGALGRELEQLRASETPPSSEMISEVRKRLDDLAVESPNNPLPIYRKAGSSSLEATKRGA